MCKNLNGIEPCPAKNRIEPEPKCHVLLALFFRTLRLQNSNLIFDSIPNPNRTEHLSSKTQTEHEPISSFYFYSQIVFYSSLFCPTFGGGISTPPPAEHSIWVGFMVPPQTAKSSAEFSAKYTGWGKNLPNLPQK